MKTPKTPKPNTWQYIQAILLGLITVYLMLQFFDQITLGNLPRCLSYLPWLIVITSLVYISKRYLWNKPILFTTPVILCLLLSLTLMSLDGYSTVRFIARDGVQMESNPIANVLFTSLGVLPGLVIMGFSGMLMHFIIIQFIVQAEALPMLLILYLPYFVFILPHNFGIY